MSVGRPTVVRRAHAGAVMLLGGWVVMFPPCVDSVHDENRVRTKCYPAAPFARWKVGRTYETEQTCNDIVARARDGDGCWNRDTKGMSAAEAAKAVSDARIESAQWMDARCVPAQHIYPATKPATK